MEKQLTAEDARQSMTAHVEAKGRELLAKLGRPLAWSDLPSLLADRTMVRYPCELAFDDAPLQPGEFAHPVQKGENPEDGFTMYVHPYFMTQLDCVPALVLYQLVALNYGVFASSDDAEAFGAAALDLSRDDYYAMVCELSDQITGGVAPEPVAESGGCGGGCNCGA